MVTSLCTAINWLQVTNTWSSLSYPATIKTTASPQTKLMNSWKITACSSYTIYKSTYQNHTAQEQSKVVCITAWLVLKAQTQPFIVWLSMRSTLMSSSSIQDGSNQRRSLFLTSMRQASLFSWEKNRNKRLLSSRLTRVCTCTIEAFTICSIFWETLVAWERRSKA